MDSVGDNKIIYQLRQDSDTELVAREKHYETI